MNHRSPVELPELLREAETGAALSEALSGLVPPAKAPPRLLRERLLATVARPRLRFAPLFGALSQLFDVGDTDLAGLFERAASAGAWGASAVPNTRLFHLQGGPRVASADNGLVRLEAGARFPTHRHLSRFCEEKCTPSRQTSVGRRRHESFCDASCGAAAKMS